MKTTVFSTLLIVLFAAVLQAQFQRPPYHEVYPAVPFNPKEVSKNNYQLVAVWFDQYKKSEGDESGIPWANQVISYQRERYILPGGSLERSAFYNESNEKLSAFQFYYQGDRISAVDEIGFDTLQNEIIRYSYHFAYKDTVPFQKVKMFNEDKGFRLLYDYLFDKEGRLLRLNITAHGEPKKEESVKMAEEDLEMVLVAHSGDSKTERFYKNMHDLQRSERTQYNELKLPINRKIKDGENRLLSDVIYIYENETLVKEIHTKYEDKQPAGEKLVYYTYHPNGLLDRIIVEEGDKQEITSFQYFEEY